MYRMLLSAAAAVLISSASPALAQTPKLGMANPAAVACVRQGGQVVTLRTAKGEVGYCRLPDGRQCEEWGLMREGRCVAPPDGAATTPPAG